MTAIQPAVSSCLRELIHRLEYAVTVPDDDAVRAYHVAESLRPALGRHDLLSPEQCATDPAHYCQHVLHTSAYFSLVVLAWLPGQATPIHDHIAWCVFGVHQGEERECTYSIHEQADGPYLRPAGGELHVTGSVGIALPPGDIHHVYNAGNHAAISLHVYGANLSLRGTSIRRRYDMPVVHT